MDLEKKVCEQLYALETLDELVACELLSDRDREHCHALRERLDRNKRNLPDTTLRCGDAVMLVGMFSAPSLNATVGKCSNYNTATGLWTYSAPSFSARVKPCKLAAFKWLLWASASRTGVLVIKKRSYLFRLENCGTIRWLLPEGRDISVA